MKFSIFSFVLVLTIFCKSEDPFKKLEQQDVKKVWEGPPEDTSKKPFEYLYMKTKGQASYKALEKKSLPIMQFTCLDFALYASKNNFINFFYEDRRYYKGYSVTGSEPDPTRTEKQALDDMYSYANSGKTNLKDCKPI